MNEVNIDRLKEETNNSIIMVGGFHILFLLTDKTREPISKGRGEWAVKREGRRKGS